MKYNFKFKLSKIDIWQYSSKGEIDGINGDVDLNVCYREIINLFFRLYVNALCF